MEEQWKKRLSSLLSEAVTLEHTAFYLYLAAGAYCESQEMSLLNLRDFFYRESSDELTHAKKVIEFMNQRGLEITFEEIKIADPKKQTIKNIFEVAEKTEQMVLEHYLLIQKEADAAGDYTTTQFIDYFIDKQVKEVKQFHDRALNARRCDSPLGLFIFDQSFSEKNDTKLS